MPVFSSNWKFLAMLALILAPGAYFVARQNWYAPSGAWANELEACRPGAVTYRFGEDITVSDGTKSKVFASHALYYKQSNGDLRVSFLTELQGRIVNVAINYNVSSQALTPRSVRLGSKDFVENFPELFRKNFTFKRCL